MTIAGGSRETGLVGRFNDGGAEMVLVTKMREADIIALRRLMMVSMEAQVLEKRAWHHLGGKVKG